VTSYRCALITDSCCDLPREIVDRYGIVVLPFPFTIGDEQHLDELGDTLSHEAFYTAMRAGAEPTTAQVPLPSYIAAFRAAAETGTPAVLLSFSSALSGTFDTALVARDAVLADFPDAEITVIDTVSASTAQALLVLEAGRLHADGATAEQIAEFAVGASQRINGYFTLETLTHLARGGRIPDVAASAGAMLDVRPVLRLDEKGALVIDKVVRGRKKSMRAVADTFLARAESPETRTVVVAHADCAEDALSLETMLRERAEILEVITIEVGPVIGTHTGPGMLACVFWGTPRAS
jgi:DegV family protein with EDD domain